MTVGDWLLLSGFGCLFAAYLAMVFCTVREARRIERDLDATFARLRREQLERKWL